MDVRNSRGKFDEIKEKFTINPTPIASQSSLNAGIRNSCLITTELEIFLKIRLLPSRIDQKLKNNEELHVFLKGKLARGSWAIDAVVGAELLRRGGGFTWRGRSFRIDLESATILLQNSFRLGTIFATIVTRSCHDRATIGRRSWYW